MIKLSSRFPLAALSASIVLSFGLPAMSYGQSGQKSYEVLSVKPDEIVVRVAPKYGTTTIRETSTGKSFTEMTFPGGAVTDSAGSPEIPRILLPFLTPDREPATVEIVSQSLEVLPNIDLAPVPAYLKTNGEFTKQYTVQSSRYFATRNTPIFEARPVEMFRTAFAEHIVVSPVQYDANSRTVTRVRTMTLRIRFPHAAALAAKASEVSPSEADLYRGSFINGSFPAFYTVSEPFVSHGSQSKFGTKSTLSTGTWLQLETTDEGIYRITAQDLANAGVTGAIDPNTIQLFGSGGEPLDETLTDQSGEMLERPIEVHSDGSNFNELYFYARGVTVWKYSRVSGIDGLYHRLNPYTSTGHFLLKVGGDPSANPMRVTSAFDTMLMTPTPPTDRVFTAQVHEVDRSLELGLVGREMIDQGIPRDDVGPITFDVSAPGYTGDSTTVRVGYDANVPDGESGYVSVQINGKSLGTISSRTDSQGDILRDWDNALSVPASISAPLTMGLTFTSSSITPTAELDFVELMYRRSTDLSGGTISFMLIDRPDAVQYRFSNATSGQVWDVSSAASPRIVATAADGNTMIAALQSDTIIMRRFMAFTPATTPTPRISAIPAPNLRDGIAQQGATEIIISPQDFLAQAEELKQLREQGGQATEAMSASVVNLEDIYREFGYGNRDITAIRDFMAYTFRHTQDASRRPLYATLLGGGHCDYQNRQTSIPEFIPPYETPEPDWVGAFRSSTPSNPTPDDSYYGRVSGTGITIVCGRVSATSADGAEGFVQKVRHYEHASDTGSWRTIATFFADDRIADKPSQHDDLDHLGETEYEVQQLPERILVDKLYEVAYPTIYSNGGRRKPLAEQAIIDAMNEGNVLFSFIGHGNPSVWTHESALNVPSTINKFRNFDRLAYVTTATCDFSEYDNFADVSGGEMFLLKPDGGAIGLLGTSRSITEEHDLTGVFYQTLFNVDPTSGFGTTSVGAAYLAGERACVSGNGPFFYLLGDPAQRLLVPKRYVNFDSIPGVADSGGRAMLPALSQVHITGSIGQGIGSGVPVDAAFNGTITVTLYDTPDENEYTTLFSDDSPIYDKFKVEGPVLYRGNTRVTNGRFSVSFIVPKDVKLDTGSAKLTGYAYSVDNRSALGDTRAVQLVGSDAARSVIDTVGPTIALWIGTRAFHSGDAVSKHSTAIVDVSDPHGLNTSTSSIGHSFIAWVDDAQDSAVDMASTFASNQDDYTSGTSEHAIDLPAGHHTLHVRAFDTFDNPSFASVDFVAKKETPYELYEVSNTPNPLLDHTVFSFTQPGQAGSLVHVTLALYTTDGRLVRTLVTDTRESAIDMIWDGRDDAGNTVANGIYMFTVNAHDLDDGTSFQAGGKCSVAR